MKYLIGDQHDRYCIIDLPNRFGGEGRENDVRNFPFSVIHACSFVYNLDEQRPVKHYMPLGETHIIADRNKDAPIGHLVYGKAEGLVMVVAIKADNKLYIPDYKEILKYYTEIGDAE